MCLACCQHGERSYYSNTKFECIFSLMSGIKCYVLSILLSSPWGKVSYCVVWWDTMRWLEHYSSPDNTGPSGEDDDRVMWKDTSYQKLDHQIWLGDITRNDIFQR